MHGHFYRVDALNFKLLHQVLAKVQRGNRRSHGALNLGKNALVSVFVFGLKRAGYVLGQRGLAHLVQLEAEFLIAPVKEKAQGASARSRIVDYFGNKAVVFAKIKLVPDADFASGVYENVPKTALRIEFAQQEYFD